MLCMTVEQFLNDSINQAHRMPDELSMRRLLDLSLRPACLVAFMQGASKATPLMLSADADQAEMIRLLVAHGADSELCNTVRSPNTDKSFQ